MFQMVFYIYIGMCIGVASIALCFIIYCDLQHRRNKLTKFKEKNDYAMQGTKWQSTQHEYNVEKFYETGLTGMHNFHGGYLNFGYWVDGNKDYVKASEALLSQVADPVKLDASSKLLDVGNGMGSQDIYYYNKYKPKHIDMIDLTLSHHLICKKRIEEHSLQHCLTAHYGSATSLPFSDCSFTHVFSVEGGIHYKFRKDFLKEAYRVLEPNGWISIVDYSICPPRNVIQNIAGRMCAKMWNAPLENLWQTERFETELKEVGFVDVVVKDIGEYCIPGYYYESTRSETQAELAKIRGWLITYVAGRIVDEFIMYLHKKKLLTELIIFGRKPSVE